MPSPFPGMNPYLERAGVWESFHTELVVAMKRQIAEQLPDQYVVRIENRVYIHEPPTSPGTSAGSMWAWRGRPARPRQRSKRRRASRWTRWTWSG